jgi:pimeloyl-ACP methyl ester carboxylesterase
LLFGDLTLDDYVTVLRNTLERLRGIGLRPQTLLGHSQGGLLIQMTQQALKSMGTDLYQQFNIQHVVLLASVGPQQILWAFVDNGTAAVLLQQFVTFDPALDVYINIPAAAWPSCSSQICPGWSPVRPRRRK